MTSHPNRSKKARKPGATPSPEWIRAAREAAGHTQAEAAALVYAPRRSWQNWEREPSDPENRRMHPAIFELYLLKTGQLPPAELAATPPEEGGA